VSPTSEQPNARKKKFSFTVVAPQEDGNTATFFFSVKDEDSRKDWVSAISKGTLAEPFSDIISKVKQSRAMRLKKNVSSAVATSGAGKDIIRKFVGKKAIKSINIVKDVALKHCGDKKRVTDLENALNKLGAKAIVLWQNGDITEEDVNEAIPTMRNLWVTTLNFCQMNFTYDGQAMKTLFNELLVAFTNILAPYVTEKTLTLLKETLLFLSEEKFLEYVFLSEAEETTRKDIVSILNTDWAKQRFQV